MSSTEFYSNQATKFEKEEQQLGRKSRFYSTIRTIIFLSWLVGGVMLVNYREMQWAFIVSAVFILVFATIVKVHNKLKFNRRQLQNLLKLNELELQRLKGNYSQLATGNEYRDELHPYVNDLDIFGKDSLFQLINRTTSLIGEKKLVQRLQSGLKGNKIIEIQEAVKVLAAQPEWSQSYQALGMHYQVPAEEFSLFQDWCQEPAKIRVLKWAKPLSIIMPLLLVIGATICTIWNITYYATLPIILINGLILSRFVAYATDTVEQTYKSVNLLKSFQLQMGLISDKNFNDPTLNALAAPFNSENDNASKKIKQLTFYLNQLLTRSNMLHIFFNITLLLDVQWLLRLEKWKEENANSANDWFERLAELEVLISQAGLSFSKKNWIFPEQSNENYFLQAQGLGHPMINDSSIITNDFEMQGQGEVILLTGPNMAGKSTFLRTIAINMVLARMGAPVCATSMRLNFECQPFTAMRVADDLSENVSSFYAELKRINQLLESAEQAEPILYFLDEILKGTNSADRHKGAEGLIKQLSKMGLSGFVSTHDLELGALAAEMKQVSNYSFESEVEGDEILFDYKLREGICKSFNACDLMRKMGIDV